MANWYTTREIVKRALRVVGADLNSLIDESIADASGEIDAGTRTFFVPRTETRRYPWPTLHSQQSWILELDQWLLALTALTKDGDTATVIAVGDVLLAPANFGPPYSRIEIDLSTSVEFSSLNTPQEAIRATGRWGYSEDTIAAGTIADSGGIDDSVKTVEISDASLVDVGDTLLIESEALTVTERDTKDTTANTDAALTADASERTVSVNDASLVKLNEVVQIDSERMLVTARSLVDNDLTVLRAYDGTALASHANPSNVLALRSLTVVRGVNGTTAAAHADATAITKYQAPPEVRRYARARAIQIVTFEKGGWTGVVGSADNQIEARGTAITALWKDVRNRYGRRYVGSV